MIKFLKSAYNEYLVPICREIGKLIKLVIGIENNLKSSETEKHDEPNKPIQ